MMSSFFPQRGRRALKLKFQRWEQGTRIACA